MVEQNLSKLPKGWSWGKMEDCVEILDSKRIPINSDDRIKKITGKPQSELVPYYGATGQVGWIDDFLFDEELVLLGEDGAPFFDFFKNKAYIIRGKSWINNHAHVLRAICGLTTNSFICHYLNIFDYHSYVSGTTRLKLNQSPMRNIPVPLPPLPEQHSIVAKIEQLFSDLDAGVEALKKAKAQLKLYRQAVLKAAFEGRLTAEWRQGNRDTIVPANIILKQIQEEKANKKSKSKGIQLQENSDLYAIPETWCWALLSALGDLNRGKSKHRPRNDPKLFGGDYPFIQTGDIRKAELIREYSQTYNEVGLKQSRLWPENTLCITIAANIAETAILGMKACFPDSVVGFIADDRLCRVEYIHFYIKTVKEKLEYYAPATAQKNINLETLYGVMVPLPPVAEQLKIVEEIERFYSLADAVETAIDQSFGQSERLRQSILKQAFSGQLVPQDPEDEPAEVLLARIREEKAKQLPVKKSKRKATQRKLDYGQ